MDIAKKIKRKIVTTLKNFIIKINSNFLIVKINNNKIKVLKENSFRDRGIKILSILKEIINKDVGILNNKKILITYDDKPLPDRLYNKYDISFCTTKKTNKTSSYISFPCPYFTGWEDAKIKSSDQLIKKMINNKNLAENKKIFWIGAETNTIRRDLVNLSKKFPNIIEAIIMNWEKKDIFVSIEDHQKYKYLIDCPGVGYSARIKWLLASGRPLFIIDREIIEPWQEELKPMIHYIPIKEDLSDLIEKYYFLENNPDIYTKISNEAKTFAINNLILDKRIEKTIEIIKNNQK